MNNLSYNSRRNLTEDVGSKVLWNAGILSQHYMASQFRKPRHEFRSTVSCPLVYTYTSTFISIKKALCINIVYKHCSSYTNLYGYIKYIIKAKRALHQYIITVSMEIIDLSVKCLIMGVTPGCTYASTYTFWTWPLARFTLAARKMLSVT